MGRMPERASQQILEDGEVLRTWLTSEYFPAFERAYGDALEDAAQAVLTFQVTGEGDLYRVLEAKGRYLGLLNVKAAWETRIRQAEKLRGR